MRVLESTGVVKFEILLQKFPFLVSYVLSFSLLNALPNDLQISGEVCFAVAPFVLHARLSQYCPLHAQSGILDVFFVALFVFLFPPPPFCAVTSRRSERPVSRLCARTVNYVPTMF